MAQVTGGTIYDFTWDRKHDAALRILTRAADRCAGSGTAAVALDKILAVILNIFGDDLFDQHRNPERWSRRVAQDLSTELYRLKPDLNPSDVADVAQQLQAEANSAAKRWALGDPENPATADLLNVLEHILFRHRIIVNAPKHQTPTSLQT